MRKWQRLSLRQALPKLRVANNLKANNSNSSLQTAKPSNNNRLLTTTMALETITTTLMVATTETVMLALVPAPVPEKNPLFSERNPSSIAK